MPQPARFEKFSGTLKPRRPATHRRDFGRDYNRGQLADPDESPTPNHNSRQNLEKIQVSHIETQPRRVPGTPEFPQPRDAVNLIAGRPFQAVVTTNDGQSRRPEKGILHFFTAPKAWNCRNGSGPRFCYRKCKLRSRKG